MGAGRHGSTSDDGKRRLRVLTASKVALAQLCTQFLDMDSEWREITGDKAIYGNIAHAEIQAGLEQAKAIWMADGRLPEPREGFFKQALLFLTQFKLDQWGPMEIERSYGTTDVAGVMLGHNRDYKNAAEGTWLVGTVDVCVPDDMLLTVVDWKTGNATKALEQLIACGALASGGYDDSELLRCISVHIEPTKWSIGIDQTMSIGEARAHVAKLKERYNRGPERVPGPHCYGEFCPHQLACLGAGADLGPKGLAPLVEDCPDLTTLADGVVMEMWAREKARAGYAEKAMARVKAEMARRGGLRAPGGFFTESFRQVPREDYGALRELARRLGASEADLAGCKRMNRESAGWRLIKDKG